uniref:Uncharacterized protein n=1 Tax=Setaria viridis TaxID=4556 RepID=A0A4V6DCQ9_SETVI|nr:hypothetical protein SEVIR_1G134750v2 [Setaria viridis]
MCCQPLLDLHLVLGSRLILYPLFNKFSKVCVWNSTGMFLWKSH